MQFGPLVSLAPVWGRASSVGMVWASQSGWRALLPVRVRCRARILKKRKIGYLVSLRFIRLRKLLAGFWDGFSLPAQQKFVQTVSPNSPLFFLQKKPSIESDGWPSLISKGVQKNSVGIDLAKRPFLKAQSVKNV